MPADPAQPPATRSNGSMASDVPAAGPSRRRPRPNDDKPPATSDLQDAANDDDDWDLDDDEQPKTKKARTRDAVHDDDLYLDTINRNLLDFDFEKVCCVSLSNINVYACLVCGKYFQGRGKTSHAYMHSLDEDHHVFINLATLKFYILPDGYQVSHASLNDIKFVINPTFTDAQVCALDTNPKPAMDLSYKKYLPGFIGINNVKANDYVNVVLQALAHVRPLRDFFLLQKEDDPKQSELVKRFGLLMRKLWSHRAFKGQVSPHELLQEINRASKRAFKFTEQGDPVQLLSWLLNALHTSLAKRGRHHLIHDVFQGSVAIQSQKIALTADDPQQQAQGALSAFDADQAVTATQTPFLMLALDLPPPPLFQDEFERNIIPQVALTALLDKYSGKTPRQYGDTVKTFQITKLPRYLILHIKRFTKNSWTLEKNPTIVNFMTQGLDMSPYVAGATSVLKYSLVANIVHEGKPENGQGVYKSFVYHRAQAQWYLIQDLLVEEVMPQMVSLGESCLQIWERADE
ncbi:hypothetical protein AMAG_04216 [Allomyces macrogynus ATCC 38327]|uniref:USP domain-containing protein n=1 Tax=Allomyces macrogynus (strain ATCC 38327) TaxID=578462 RepID=A0A0L0S7T0_ALLM3|nr:hypothetical protein AMAG_04216 [Allomyces macrogynus ATCC 38327]|eukprot:KNE58658.1 hypothetical protein AMAG_04216 [Allomyces macrogynus ATCC 38327]